MKQTIFKGSGVAIITPMLEDGSVNYPVLKELLEQQIAGGTDAIVICGTTGETRFRLRGAKRSTRTIALPDSGMKSVYGRPSRRMRISAK